MSTKIYGAYRFPLGRLEKFVSLFNNVIFREVAELAGERILPDKERNAVRKRMFGPRWKTSKEAKNYEDSEIDLIWTLAQAVEMSKTGRNHCLNFDAAFNLWVKGGDCFVLPYVPNGIHLSKWMSKKLDYSYWNNTDPSEEVSAKEWKKRGKVWDYLTGDWNKYRITRTVIDLKTFDMVGLTTVLRHLYDNDKWVDKMVMAIYSLSAMLEEDRIAKNDPRTLRV